jgi:ribonuclease HII
MTLISGVDEAGRGPVIGPMVMAGVLIDKKDEAKLKRMGVKDSKLLTPGQRERLYNKIVKTVKKYHIVIVPPAEIDQAVKEDDEMNLNWLEAQKSIDIINILRPDTAYLDCPSNNIKAYAEYVKKGVNGDTEIIAEHKADVKYPVVSAASIIAKVTRDREIGKIQETIPDKIGSGYPSDPVTVEFLKKNYSKYPDIIRKSWASYQAVVNEKQQRKLGDF